MRARSARRGPRLAGAALRGGDRLRPDEVAVEREHVDVYFADGSMVSLEPGSPRETGFFRLARRVLAAARGDDGRRARSPPPRARASRRGLRPPLGRRSSYYLDKYRFETRPELLRELGERIAARVARVGARGAASRRARARRRRARRVGLARRRGFPSSSSARRRRSTGRRAASRGSSRQGEEVCLVEDVVTSGGAAVEAVRPSGRPGSSAGRRSAWSIGRREEPTLSRAKRSASTPLFRAQDILPG